MKVLVTGAGAVLGQGIIRSLRESGLGATIVAADPSPLSAGLYWTERRHLLPMAKDPGFVARIEELLALERPDAIIPGTDVELHHFASHRARWEARFATQVVVSSPEVVQIADDKWLTFQFLRDRGFPVPDSCLAGDEDALVARVGFPLIVKPRVGARSVGVVKVHDRAALARAVADGEHVVVQECVAGDGDEYTAGALVFDGVCRASIVMRRDLRDGNTYRAYVAAYPALDAQVRRMAEALAPHGPANFQFRVDGAGQAKVFEINGRYSGTTPFRMRAGFNEVELTLRHLVLGEPVTQPAIQPMTILRHFEETVVPDGGLVPR
jgi:carbamoyl-phosphate synthase large subunit